MVRHSCPFSFPESYLVPPNRCCETIPSMQACSANCYIPSRGGRTRDRNYVRILDQPLCIVCTYFCFHSDPPSPLRALQIGSQLLANMCTRSHRVVCTSTKPFLSCGRLRVYTLVRV